MIADGIRQRGHSARLCKVGPPATAVIAVLMLGGAVRVFGIVMVVLAILYMELHSQRA